MSCSSPAHRGARWPNRTRRPACSLAILGVATLAVGCIELPVRSPSDSSRDDGFFGWHVQAPFDTSDVKTVFVFFKTQSFRRDIQLQLVEAVEKEISLRTPYRVVGDPKKADSLLSGTITYSDKNLVVEAPTNLPRQLNATISIRVNWTHNPPNEVEKNRLPTLVSETINFVPEVGETSMTAFYEVVQSIAKQIVDMMEQPWFTDEDLE
jgi:hypothetical protein